MDILCFSSKNTKYFLTATQKNILYQNMKLYDDKKGEIMIQLYMTFWYKVYII